MIDTPIAPIQIDRQWNGPEPSSRRVPGTMSSGSRNPLDSGTTNPDQAAFLKQMASRLGADPNDARVGTPEGLARLGAERMVSIALIEPLVREAREASAPTGMFAPGPGEKRFGHLLDRNIADSIAASPRFGGVVSLERRLLDRINRTLGPQQAPMETRSSTSKETLS